MAGRKSLARYVIRKATPFLGSRGRFVLCLVARFGLVLLVVGAVFSATFAAGVRVNEHQRLVEVALRSVAEAENLQKQHDLSSVLAAIAKYDDAQRLLLSAGERGKAAEALCDSGDLYFYLSRYQDALSQYQQALADAKGDELTRLRALNGIGYMYSWLGKNNQAVAYAQRVLTTIERLDSSRSSQVFARLKAQAINTVGEVQYASRKLPESIETFERTLPLWKQADDSHGEALALLNIGYSRADSGDLRTAADYYDRSLQIFHTIDDKNGVAIAGTALGGVRSVLGEMQSALDSHKQAIEYFHQTGNKQGKAVVLNGIATAYEDLNEYQAAIEIGRAHV